MLSRVFDFFTHLFEPTWWVRNRGETLKRKRFPNDENDMQEGATAHKRLRPCGILTDSNSILRNITTQTDMTPQKILTFDLTKDPNEKMSQKSSEQTVSPLSKNKFKAPAHCRSPGRVLRSRPLFVEDDDDEPKYMGTTVLTAKNKNPVARTPKKSKIGECSGVSRKNLTKINTPKSLSENSRALNSFMKKNRVTSEHNLSCKEKYMQLLGTLLRNPEKYPHFQVWSGPPTPSIGQPIDLTSEDSDDDVVHVSTFKLHPNVSLRQKTPTPKKVSAYVDLTKRNTRSRNASLATIDLCSEENEANVAPIQIPRINSLEEALKQIPITQDNWINELTKKHQEEKSKGIAKREKLEKECKALIAHSESKLDDLLTKEITKHLAITESVIIDDEQETVLPDLTPEMLKKIRDATSSHLDQDEILAEKFGYSIRRRDLKTLADLTWLNDEVINFYMSLLMERSKDKDYPSVYACNTFFYQKIQSAGHAGVRRWTRKVDIFAQDFVIVPIHLQLHWCMVAIDMKEKMINYYDSMGGNNDKCLNLLIKYLEDEMKDKKNEIFDRENWTLNNAKNIPQQMNGSDCGIFACTFAEYVCRRAAFTFSQDDMSYFRKKMVWEILQGELLL